MYGPSMPDANSLYRFSKSPRPPCPLRYVLLNACPFSVRLYRWFRPFFSGLVISTIPDPKAGARWPSMKCTRSPSSTASISSARLISPFSTSIRRSTCGVPLLPRHEGTGHGGALPHVGPDDEADGVPPTEVLP